MPVRVRLLPMTMVATGMLLAVKVADVIHGGESIISPVKAQTSDSTTSSTTSSSGESSTTSSTSSSGESSTASSTSSSIGESSTTSSTTSSSGESSTTSSTSSSSGESSTTSSTSSSSGESSTGSSGASSTTSSGEGGAKVKKKDKKEKKSEGPTEEQQSGGRGLAPGTRYFSPIELEILQTLSKRREALDQWSRDVETKENLLSNTEKRIDAKIVEIGTLKKDLQDVLAKYNQQEDAKIRSLVKIYESMNPKDAARIFDEVEMPILLLVIDKMSEKKAAPILAAMDPKKAKMLTVELAEERRLQSNRAKAVPLTTAPVKATP